MIVLMMNILCNAEIFSLVTETTLFENIDDGFQFRTLSRSEESNNTTLSGLSLGVDAIYISIYKYIYKEVSSL